MRIITAGLFAAALSAGISWASFELGRQTAPTCPDPSPCSAPAFKLHTGKTLVVCKGEVMFQVEVPADLPHPDDK